MACRLAALTALATLALAVGASPPAGSGASAPHVTIFGDSAADGLQSYPPARQILVAGFDFDFEIEECRRVDQLSCPNSKSGVRPPNLLDVVAAMGSKLGPTVVVDVGYNDYVDEYARNIANALVAMEKIGVKRVLWVNLRASRHSYLTMNDDILTAAARDPRMIVVDWNLYSRSHPDWFQPDEVHLTVAGAVALATLLHTTLVQLQPAKKPAATPVRIVTAYLPDARKGKPYAARLAASGGKPPYFWSLPQRLPRALRLRPGGWIGGTPRRQGAFTFALRVSDSAGTRATRYLRLRVRP